MTLAELRQAAEMTQTQLAEALDLTQPGISRIEHQTDLYVSTLRSYVSALGGQLEIVARFPQVDIPIRSFEKLSEMKVVPDQSVEAIKTKFATIGDAIRANAQVLQQSGLDQAMKAIRGSLEADVSRVLQATSTKAFNETLKASVEASIDASLAHVRNSIEKAGTGDVRTVPADEGGWEVRLARAEGDEESMVSVRTKKSAVKVGREIARCTGGKLHVYRRDGTITTSKRRRSAPSSGIALRKSSTPSLT